MRSSASKGLPTDFNIWNISDSGIGQSDIPDILPVKCYQPPSCPFSNYNATADKVLQK